MNMQDSKYCNTIYGCILVAFVLVIFMLVSFNAMVRKEYRPIYGEFKTELKLQLADSDSLIEEKHMTVEEYTHKVDSLVSVVSNIQSSYHHDIDLMIYKTNQWLTFWLAALGIIVGFLSVLNVFSQYRFKDEFSTIKTENSSWKNEQERKIERQVNQVKRDVISGVEGKLAVIDAKITDQKDKIEDNHKIQLENNQQLEAKMKKSKCETHINTLMSSISTFPDPQMFQSSSEKKDHIAFFMKEMLINFEEYLKENETAINDNSYDLKVLIVILMNIKTASFRCHPVYSVYHQNVPFFKFKQDIDNLTDDLIRGRISHQNLKERLNPVVDSLRELVYSIL